MSEADHKPLSPAEQASIDEARSTRRSATIAAFSAIVSIIAIGAAVGVGLYSANLVRQQNANAQQQELVSLITDIAQGRQASTSSTVNPQLATLGEAQEADNIMKNLPNPDVSSVERYIVAVALKDGQDYQPALQLFKRAALEASDPRSASDAWRGAANVLYILKLNSQAENDINLAKKSYSGPDVTSFSMEQNIAFTDIYDVQYQAFVSCSTATKEWIAAAQFIRGNPNFFIGNNNANTAATNGKATLASACKVQPDTLNKISPPKLTPP